MFKFLDKVRDVIVYFALVEPRGEPWFKRTSGKGPVVSVAWQGYLTLALWALLTVLVFWSVDQTSHSVSDTLINIIPTEVLLYVTLILVYFKKLEGN